MTSCTDRALRCTRAAKRSSRELRQQHVIVVGAGPVGLVTANLLVDEGIAVSLVEACEDLPRDLRASTFHPPTLDMLERFGVVGRMIEQGLICPTWQFRDRNEGVIATFELARLSPDTNHPYRLQCEQWRLGEMLYARLKDSPLATIRFGTKAVAARQSADGVELDVRLPDGGSETIRGTFPGRRRRNRQRRAPGDRRGSSTGSRSPSCT